jgi:hypothetical protein
MMVGICLALVLVCVIVCAWVEAPSDDRDDWKHPEF